MAKRFWRPHEVDVSIPRYVREVSLKQFPDLTRITAVVIHTIRCKSESEIVYLSSGINKVLVRVLQYVQILEISPFWFFWLRGKKHQRNVTVLLGKKRKLQAKLLPLPVTIVQGLKNAWKVVVFLLNFCINCSRNCGEKNEGDKSTHTLIKLSPLSSGDKSFAVWVPGHAGQTVFVRLRHFGPQLPRLATEWLAEEREREGKKARRGRKKMGEGRHKEER